MKLWRNKVGKTIRNLPHASQPLWKMA